MIRSIIPKVRKVLWAFLLVSLPVTNFPYFPAALGGTRVSVRPLLLYPLFLLVVMILPTLWKRKLPRVWLPFLTFVLLALISSLLPLFSGVTSEISEITLSSRLIRTLVTLFLAGAIYLVVSLTPMSEEDLDFTLKWLYVGLLISLIWGTLQLIYVLDLIPGWYKTMKKFQRYITISRGSKDRLIGLTQEPSWFADQLAALYLPWIYVSFLRGKTVFRRITRWLTVETILVGWTGLILVFTLSRSGYLTAAFVLMAGFLFFRSRDREFKINLPGFGFLNDMMGKFMSLHPAIRTIISGAVLLILGGLVLFVASQESSYISRMWDYWLGSSTEFQALGSRSLKGYIRYIGFGPRFVYWETAFNIFQSYPLLGVGLGNYTFYFKDYLPASQLGYMPELLRILVPDQSSVITAKNYFARLLAETGIIGTAAYLVFLFANIGQGVYLWASSDESKRFWGAAALLGMGGFLVNTFSYDSFSIPNPWIVFGLTTAAFHTFTTLSGKKEEDSG